MDLGIRSKDIEYNIMKQFKKQNCEEIELE